MIQGTNEQLYLFLNALYAGVATALVYDVFHYLLFYKREKKTLSDILFWLCICAILPAFLIARMDLVFRGWIIFGIFAGWAVYVLLFSRAVRRVFVGVNIAAVKGAEKVGQAASKMRAKTKEKTAPVKNKAKKYLSIPFFELKRYNKFKEGLKKGNKRYGKSKNKEKNREQ